MTSYQCKGCSKVILNNSNPEQQETKSFNDINTCQYCDYVLCDQCNRSKEHKTALHLASIHLPNTYTEDVCLNCLKTKPICVSCHTLFLDNEKELSIKCEICQLKVCSCCVKAIDNLHCTAKKFLCLDCHYDWTYRPLYAPSTEWYRTECLWFHDGCERTETCGECGRAWCVDHDFDKFYQCIDPLCPYRHHGDAYCAKCVGQHYENAGYCSLCVVDKNIMKINVI